MHLSSKNPQKIAGSVYIGFYLIGQSVPSK